MPWPEKAVTGWPSSRRFTPCTVGNWLIVYTTWASRIRSDSEPPPESNPPDRSTVAMPSTMFRPKSWVPVGTEVATPAAFSSAEGPARSAVSAALPTATVKDWVRALSNRVSPFVNHTSTVTVWLVPGVVDGEVEGSVGGEVGLTDGDGPAVLPESILRTATAPPEPHAAA